MPINTTQLARAPHVVRSRAVLPPTRCISKALSWGRDEDPTPPRSSGTVAAMSWCFSRCLTEGPRDESLCESMLRRTSSKSRILSRRGKRMFFQAIGKFKVGQRKTATMSLYSADLWHTILGLSAWKIVLLVAILYTISFALFAWFYMLVDPVACGLEDKHSFADFYQFSMQTGVTIGYGTADPSFRGCSSMAVLITLQSIISMLLDAFCIGVVYDRISAAGNRGRTIVFSNKAVLDRIGGLWHLQFRAADIRRMQLSESHVRLVAVWHDIGEAGERVHYFQSENLRVHDPDDEIGGDLLLVLPRPITHVLLPVAATRTDPRSPLLPSAAYFSAWREMAAAGVPEGTMTAWQWRERQLAAAKRARPQRLLPFGPMYEDGEDEGPEGASGGGDGPSRRSSGGGSGAIVHRRRSKAGFRRGTAGAAEDADMAVPGRAEGALAGVASTVEGLLDGSDCGPASVNGTGSADDGESRAEEAVAAAAAAAEADGGRAVRMAPNPLSRGASGSKRTGLAGRAAIASGGAGMEPLTPRGIAHEPSAAVEEERILRFWRESEMELLCMIEGIDSVSSDTTQARHSYTVDDLVVGETFVPCTKRAANGACIVEFDLFHDTEPSSDAKSYEAPGV